MQISRIVSITPDGDFDTQNGHMWAFIVRFEDGNEGQANAKKSPPPYRVGDSVGYDITGQTPRGVNKLKIDRKAGQTAGVPIQQAQQARNAPPTYTPVAMQVGAGDDVAFHNTLKKLSLLWLHCLGYSNQIEHKLADMGHPLLSPEQKQALVASLWIAARDAGLAQHPPALQPPVRQPVPPQAMQPQSVPAGGPGVDDDVPFARFDPIA